MSNVQQVQRQQEDRVASASTESFWSVYSPRGEFPLSSTASVVFYLLLVLLIIFIGRMLVTPPVEPPGVDVLEVGPEPTAAQDQGPGDGPQSDESLEAAEPSQAEPAPATTPTEDVAEVDERPEAEVEVPDAQGPQQQAKRKAQEASEAARSARERLAAAKNRLNENLGGAAGGSGPRGRAARVARWILLVEPTSAQDYLAQMGGLGAEIAFPDRDEKYLYFSNLASPTPTRQLKDLFSETRLYWIDQNPQSVAMVCQHLGVRNSGFFLAFLPRELEERMLRMELAYMNLAEEEIASTTFRVVRRGGGYDVQVESQIPR